MNHQLFGLVLEAMVEQHLEAHSEVVFSHGFRPDRAKRLYPGLVRRATHPG